MSLSAHEDKGSAMFDTDAASSSTATISAIDTSDIYKNVGGRDSELGRILFNMYNKGRVSYTPNVQIKSKPTVVDPQSQLLVR